MSGAPIHARIKPDDQAKLKRFFGEAMALGGNMLPLMRQVSVYIAQVQERTFRLKGRGDHPWKDLAESTKREKERLGYSSSQPLVRDGQLKRNWDFRAYRYRAYGIAKSPIAGYHHWGTPNDRPPQRVLISWEAEDWPVLISLVQGYIAKLKTWTVT